MAKSTHILHNTMKPSTRPAAVEHEAWARGTRGQNQGPGPGDQNQAADPEGKTGTHSIIRQQQSQTREQPRDSERQRDLGMTDQVNKTDRGK